MREYSVRRPELRLKLTVLRAHQGLGADVYLRVTCVGENGVEMSVLECMTQAGREDVVTPNP